MTKTAPVIITTVPFGEVDPKPLDLMKQAKIDYIINPKNQKLQADEVAEVIGDHEIVIAGTEPITKEVMEKCPKLRAICRVGIGLDNVDLIEARKRNITVTYTPDGPSDAVSELTIGLMLDCLRQVSFTDRNFRNGIWKRSQGKRLGKINVGIIGVGRIGSRVVNHLLYGFPGIKIHAFDINKNTEFHKENSSFKWTDLDQVLSVSDIISIHTPLTADTRNLINLSTFKKMKPDSILINTARGGIVNETDLHKALTEKLIAGSAVDVFENEPYKGPLIHNDNCILTCHMGSMTEDCRAKMEIGATEDAIRFLLNQKLINPVPANEYEIARLMNYKN